ncbi:PQQ-dependent sugar dehydrogenase [Maribacter sp. X9]|uniref:PQQ-dependent sugar dehydrogenase n=1 Tax=Maribacter sp. X9 TaxID=3402159 RepID=UPI003AF39FF4
MNITTSRFILPFIFLLVFIANGQVSYQNAFPNVSFNFPVEIQSSIDGSNKLFIVEQTGRIKVFSNNNTIKAAGVTTFLDISSTVSYSAGQEIGLLGMAFHPNYATNGYVFVYYIDRPSNYRINIVRYKVNSSDPNTLDPSSQTIIAQFTKNQGDSNHNGGKIAFGPDGYLYISIGDGGGGGDPQGNGQNLNTVFGSLLRIDVDVDGNNPLESNPDLPNGNYEIPSDNPRVGQTGLDELYAWGIRNTWKFSFDATGKLWGADVGQGDFEEINLITKGGNYGWNRFEANSQPSFGSGTSLVTTPDIKPIFFYDHDHGDVSITGGYVYQGSLANSVLQNKYIYADYVSGRVWALGYNEANGSTDNQLLFRTNGELISSFGEDELGELYFAGYGSSAKIFKLTGEKAEPTTTPVNGVGEWRNLSSGVNGTVETIIEAENNKIYVGGSFRSAGSIGVSNLAIRNDDGTWEAFGEGSNGTIFSLALAPNGNLYAAGEFSQIGGISANNIAFWNGTSWSSLGTGTNGPVSKIAFDSMGNLFVGGVFTEANGITVNNIAQWKNGIWGALTDSSTGITGTNNEIRAIAFDENNTLYIGGNFDTAGGNSAARIAQWDGVNWSALGPGTSGFVQAIEANADYIYAGGNFTVSGSQTVNRIARYNRSTKLWEMLGNGLSGNVNSLKANGEYLYVAGTFETASDDGNTNKIVNNIARWSTDEGWQALGPNTTVGVDNRVNSLTFTKNNTELIAGGNFATAGSVSVGNIATWAAVFCTDESIIPKYQINGEWSNGNNAITVTEGDQLILSILSNDTPFTIKLPNGSIINGEYNLENIQTEQSGTYLFTTAEGCSKSLQIIVKEADADNDGILDSKDNCPNTPSGETVDENGCSISIFPADQFKITSTGTSCITTNNGFILIESKTTDPFSATISGPEKEESIEFSELLKIDNLKKGTYTLCITSTNYPDYKNCSKIIISEPDPLSVQLEVNSLTNSVSLKMSGSKGYTVSINGKSTHTNSNEINLQLYEEVNTVSVVSDQLCLGKFEETILLENAILIYPNPIANDLKIDTKSLTSEFIEISVFSETGVLLRLENYKVNQSPITLDMSSLSSGIYFLRLKDAKINKSFKIIKS